MAAMKAELPFPAFAGAEVRLRGAGGPLRVLDSLGSPELTTLTVSVEAMFGLPELVLLAISTASAEEPSSLTGAQE